MELCASGDNLPGSRFDSLKNGFRSSRVVAFSGSETVRQTLSALFPENNITR